MILCDSVRSFYPSYCSKKIKFRVSSGHRGALSSFVLNTSKDRESKTSLDSLFQCFTTLITNIFSPNVSSEFLLMQHMSCCRSPFCCAPLRRVWLYLLYSLPSGGCSSNKVSFEFLHTMPFPCWIWQDTSCNNSVIFSQKLIWQELEKKLNYFTISEYNQTEENYL